MKKTNIKIEICHFNETRYDLLQRFHILRFKDTSSMFLIQISLQNFGPFHLFLMNLSENDVVHFNNQWR
jgi:hypothetical protein